MHGDYMARIKRSPVICIILVCLVLLTVQALVVASQPSETLQPRFSKALVLVRQAEAAGATHEETAGLVLLLNKALQLDEQAAGAPASDGQRRAELLAQAEEALGRVETEAGQLEVIAARRTFNNRLFAYFSAGILAIVSTLVFVLAASFSRRYRIKRTFQMRVFRK